MNALNDAPIIFLIALIFLTINSFRLGGARYWTNGKLMMLWSLVLIFILAMLAGGR